MVCSNLPFSQAQSCVSYVNKRQHEKIYRQNQSKHPCRAARKQPHQLATTRRNRLRVSERPRHFITVLLAHNRFDEFERFLHGENGIESADKTSGDGCYHLVYLADERNTLDSFLTRLSVHGRYRVASAIRRIIG